MGENFEYRLSYSGKKLNLICAKAHKIAFASKTMAKAELKRIRESETVGKKPIRVYECEDCGGWHLTSRELEKFKK